MFLDYMIKFPDAFDQFFNSGLSDCFEVLQLLGKSDVEVEEIASVVIFGQTMQKMLELLKHGILRKKMREKIFAFQFEFPSDHDNFPMLHNFDNKILLEETNLFNLFVMSNFLAKGRDGIEFLFLVLAEICDSSQRYGQIFLPISAFVFDDVVAVGQFFPVHVAELFVEIGVVLQNFQIFK